MSLLFDQNLSRRLVGWLIAEQVVPADGASISVLRGSTSHEPAPLLNLVIGVEHQALALTYGTGYGA